MNHFLFWTISFCLLAISHAAPPIARKIPPPGIELPAEQQAALQTRLTALQQQLKPLKHPRRSDAEIFLKAVDLALDHGEFYKAAEIPRAAEALDHARKRLQQLGENQTSWAKQRGLVVRGYYSSIDGSAQPYGLEIPQDLDFQKPAPLYVWLHGRGDKTTDLHFIAQRQTRAGKIAATDSIVLHPFGRHCMGFKSAGEIDVLEAIRDVQSQYKIDPRRIVLMGFSMGGAGCWHLGAHYNDHWTAVSPGAGFAETARYNRLKPEQFPVWYEQKLWSLYDVPGYVRNLFNAPIAAYSGENDKQIQAARVMEEAFQQQGRKLPHWIGPKMGHKYHPETLKELMAIMRQAASKGRPQQPKKVFLQTRTLRYSQMHWVQALRLEKHWEDSRIDAELASPLLKATTKNVARVRFQLPSKQIDAVQIDGQTLDVEKGLAEIVLQKQNGRWRLFERSQEEALAKRPGLQGPIDDVFLAPFLVVRPTGKSPNAAFQTWSENELAHFQQRWRALFRGDLRIKDDVRVTEEDRRKYHLILWGDRYSNRETARVIDRLPLKWDRQTLSLRGRDYPAARHAAALIYPNPEQPDKYVVLNSGPTFREGHDRTNSLQNPKLPDWAVIDLSLPPSNLAPGKIADAGFFDEAWRVQAQEP